MSKLQIIINNLILFVLATISVVFASFIFTHVPPHTHTISGICDMTNKQFNNQSRYSICNDFTRTDYDEENHIARYEGNFILPADIKAFALRIPPVDADFELYINDKLIYSHSTETGIAPLMLPSIREYIFDGNSRFVNITFYTRDTNQFFTSPSLNPLTYRDFLIGSISSMYFYQNLFVLFDVILISICVISVAFHFIAFLYRNINKIHIYFSLLSISGVLGLALSNQRCLSFIINPIPLDFGTKMIMFSLFLRLFSILEIEKISFTALTRRKTYSILKMGNFVLLALVVIIPMPYAFYILPIYYIFILISVLVAINEGRKSYHNDHNPLTRIIIFGLILLFIGAFSDLTHLFGINKAYSLFYVHQCIFIIMQSIVTSIDYSNVLEKNKRLTDNLKQKIFEIQNNESSFMTSHINPTYIYDTLNIIKNSIEKDQDQVDILIQSMSKYLRHTFDYATTNNIYSYKDELELCYAYKNMITAKYPFIKINFDVSDFVPNTRIPMFSIMSLIENSVNLTVKKVLHPEIDVKIYSEHDSVTFSVTDNGIGMSKDEIEYCLEHPLENLAYGIYQTNQLLIDKCNSKLQINSVINKHTTALFTILTDTEDDI